MLERKVLVLIGETGSGKTTLQETLCKAMEQFRPLVSYTTRIKRKNEIDGVHYHFITEDEFKDMENAESFIETATYYASSGIGGVVNYGLSKAELAFKSKYIKAVTNLATGETKEIETPSIPVTVMTPHGFEELCKYLGRDKVLGVYVATNPLTRLKKAIDRNPELKDECLRRFEHDKEIYTEKVVGQMDLVVTNDYTYASLKNAIEAILKQYMITEKWEMEEAIKENSNTVKIWTEEGVEIPKYETKGAAGMDVKAFIKEPMVFKPFERKLVPTGIKVALPEGIEMQARTRSGMALKHGMIVANSPGTIDEDYRGFVGIIMMNMNPYEFTIQPGERVAQLVFAKVEKMDFEKVETVEELGKTERGEGGFGSTGK